MVHTQLRRSMRGPVRSAWRIGGSSGPGARESAVVGSRCTRAPRSRREAVSTAAFLSITEHRVTGPRRAGRQSGDEIVTGHPQSILPHAGRRQAVMPSSARSRSRSRNRRTHEIRTSGPFRLIRCYTWAAPTTLRGPDGRGPDAAAPAGGSQGRRGALEFHGGFCDLVRRR